MLAGDHLVKVCEVLKISPFWLVTGKGSQNITASKEPVANIIRMMNAFSLLSDEAQRDIITTAEAVIGASAVAANSAKLHG